MALSRVSCARRGYTYHAAMIAKPSYATCAATRNCRPSYGICLLIYGLERAAAIAAAAAGTRRLAIVRIVSFFSLSFSGFAYDGMALGGFFLVVGGRLI